jgi:hypothetical protein
MLILAGIGYGTFRFFNKPSSSYSSYRKEHASSTSLSEQTSGSPVTELSEEQFEKEKWKAFDRVNAAIRRYNRREAEWQRSEELYLEGVHLYTLAYAQLYAQKTPGLFAGEVPSHDARAFDDYVEAGETALEEIDYYVEKYHAADDENYPSLEKVREEVADVVETAVYPGSGSKMQDARNAIVSPEYAAVKARTDAYIEEFAKEGVLNVGSSIWGVVQRHKGVLPKDVQNMIDQLEQGFNEALPQLQQKLKEMFTPPPR